MFAVYWTDDCCRDPHHESRRSGQVAADGGEVEGSNRCPETLQHNGRVIPESLAVNAAVITRVTFSYYSSYSHSHSLSLKVTVCHSKSQSVTQNHSLSLKITVCHSKSQSVTQSHSLSLKITVCHSKSQSVTQSHCQKHLRFQTIRFYRIIFKS